MIFLLVIAAVMFACGSGLPKTMWPHNLLIYSMHNVHQPITFGAIINYWLAQIEVTS